MESEQTSVLRPLILVAEDDDSNFKLIKAIIGKKCDIEWAKNGEEMVQLFQEHQYRASAIPVSYTHLRAHETGRNLVCRLLLEKKKKKNQRKKI